VNKKKSKFLPIIAIVVVGAFIFTMLLPTIFAALGTEKGSLPEWSQNKKDTLQQANSIEAGPTGNEAKYFTSSKGGNVDVGVIFMNPIVSNEDYLVFKVMLNTHSVDLTKYSNLNKFVELQVSDNVVIKDGFIWESESNEGHHISGTLKVKNDYNGKPILTDDTEYLKLIFKNIADVKEREHIYKKDTLR
jgi:hypothetical protein